jgi:aminoglycoside 6'-N-acetyltransferase I
MNATVRKMVAADRPVWAELRAHLWTDESPEVLRSELDEFLQREGFWGFLAELPGGDPAGFAELAVRDYANGCLSRPVPFLEGIWVDPRVRRQGIGAALLAAAEAFLIVQGFSELGSDALIDNGESHAAHAAWGFAETERVVYFRKRLGSTRA